MNGAAVWRLLIDPPAGSAWNMAADEAMLRARIRGDIPPTLRFYAWEPPAVSLGYFQRAGAEVDLEACAKQGIEVVRRLTGGRAVLHEAEVTYSLVVNETEPYIPAGVSESYRFFSRGILDGLARLGIDARLQAPGAVAKSGSSGSRSPACFDAASFYELTAGGRKVVGSAQVRTDGVLLQHGSILLRFDAGRLAGLLRLRDQASRQELAGELTRRATGLSEAAGRPVSHAEVVEAVCRGMESACRLRLVPGGWTEAERRASDELAVQKYGTEDWNLERRGTGTGAAR